MKNNCSDLLKKGIWLIFGIFIILALSQNASALTNVDSCQTLSSAGETYVLNASIEDSLSSTCFLFSDDNITLDCSGFTINMTNTTSGSAVFDFVNRANAVVKNCIIYAKNNDSNIIVLTYGVSNLTYQNNSAYISGVSWHGNANDNVVSITGNYFNQSCFHGGYEPSLRMTGQYVNYDNNVFDAFCDNTGGHDGTNSFQELNYSTITNSIFNIAGSADEPLTFHKIHGNLIDNITINATNLESASAGMVGRFCCGTDNIFRNSRLYLNWTFNIYAVNYLGNNITWDNIYMEATGNPLVMNIMDYDNVTIKNSVFKGISQQVYGNNVNNYPANNTLNSLVMDNITSDKSISFTNATVGDSWNLTNSYYKGGLSLANVSNAFLLKSSYLNYSSGNNIVLDSLSNYNTIYNNTFNVGNVVDSGTGNVYCVNGTGNTYTGGSAYSGSGLGTCSTLMSYIDSCQTLSTANHTYILNATITQNSGVQCLYVTANNITIDGAGYSMTENFSGGRLIESQNVNYFTVRNITTDCRGILGGTRGISLANTNNSLIEYANVLNCSDVNGGNIRLNGVNNGIFKDINTSYSTAGSGGNGIYIFTAPSSNNLYFLNVNSSFNNGAGILFSSGVRYGNITVENSTFIRNGNRGILFWNMTNSQIINSYFERNSGSDCIDIEYSENVTMVGNNLQHCRLAVRNSNNTAFQSGIINITAVLLNIVEPTNVTTFAITDSILNGMNCSGQLNAFSTVGNIYNVLLRNNTWNTCGGIYYHSENSGIVYNSTFQNERIYMYNYTGETTTFSIVWWTNANVTNFWNNYIETHLPDYPSTPMSHMWIKSDNADVRNITYVFYGMPATVLRFDSSNTSGRKQNVHVENISMTCMTAGCMNNTPANFGIIVVNTNGFTLRNFRHLTGGVTALSIASNSTNVDISDLNLSSRITVAGAVLITNRNSNVTVSNFNITSNSSSAPFTSTNTNGVTIHDGHAVTLGATLTSFSFSTNTTDVNAYNLNGMGSLSVSAVSNASIQNSSFVTIPSSFPQTGCSVTASNVNFTNTLCNGTFYSLSVVNSTAGSGIINAYFSTFIGNMSGVDARNNMVVNIYNSTITRTGTDNSSNMTGLDQSIVGSLRTRNFAVINCYNCTMNDEQNISAINSSQVNVYWHLNFVNPLTANAKIYESDGDLVADFSTGNSLWLRQAMFNASGRNDMTPHSIGLTKSGYSPKTDSINMDTNKAYTVSMQFTVINQLPEITGQLVVTLGFGIIGLFTVLGLIVMGSGMKDPEVWIKLFIGIAIVLLMLVGVWQGIVLG